MSEFNYEVQGGSSVRFPTAGKYCEKDIVVTAIGNAEEKLKASEYPDYVKTEAARVATAVRSVLKDDSIVSIKISDTHYVGDTATTTDNFQSDKSNIHACMAIKALAYLLPVDYIAHLGDVGAGTVMQNNTAHKKELTDYLQYFREAVGDIPMFVAIGNHDTAIYYHRGQTDGKIHTLPGDWLYDNFTSLSESDDTVISGEDVGGYCYRDFEGKKLRVFLLNTSEKLITNQIDHGASETQQLWVAQALKNLNEKTDAASWGFVVLSHYALDYGDAWRISKVFKAYTDGTSLTLDGTTVDFNNSNKAKFYAQFHGHFHCFKTDNLHCPTTNDPNTMKPYDAWRLCTPNAGFNAENKYKDITYYGINFGEEKDYPKTPDAADDTSFVVDVVNPSEQTIHSFYYGAGYNRTVSLKGIIYYSISKNLTLVSVINESSATVEEGGSYTCEIVPRDNCTLESVVVTMGGNDVTASFYNPSTGMIHIPSVTGLVVITAIAKAPPVNLVTMATAIDGVTPFGEDYNGDGVADGYQKGMMLGSNGEYVGDEYAAGITTGWIPVNPKKATLTLKNFGTETVYYSTARITYYGGLRFGGSISTINLNTLTPDSDGNLVITPSMWGSATASNTPYIRVSGKWTSNPPEIYAE